MVTLIFSSLFAKDSIAIFENSLEHSSVQLGLRTPILDDEWEEGEDLRAAGQGLEAKGGCFPFRIGEA